MRFGLHAACALGFLLCTTVSVQAAPKLLPPAGEATVVPGGTETILATGLFASKYPEQVGDVETRLVKAIRDGDKLTVTVRFRPLARKGTSEWNDTIYDKKMSEKEWEQHFYLTSGNKKYLILKDGDGKWLAPDELILKTGAGSWSATFPAPPAGQKAVLHMRGLEALGPFTVP